MWPTENARRHCYRIRKGFLCSHSKQREVSEVKERKKERLYKRKERERETLGAYLCYRLQMHVNT